jgi:hypothetical protein
MKKAFLIAIFLVGIASGVSVAVDSSDEMP